MDKLFHWKYAPLRAWKWFIRIPRELKWLYQRMRYGYSDQDSWGANGHIARVVLGTVRNIIKHDTGPNAVHDRDDIEDLHTIVRGFEAYLDDSWLMKPGYKELFDKGMEALNRRFLGLWW